MTSLLRHDWFEFLGSLRPSTDGDGVTPLLPIKASQAMMSAAVLEVPMDWWIHTGGPLRKALEVEFQAALSSSVREVCFCLRMKPDPVLSFEIEAWNVGVLQPLLLERGPKTPVELSFSSSPKEKSAWSQEVSAFSELSWRPLAETASDRAEFWLESLGLLSLSQGFGIFETFINEMVGASVDPAEPPWIFWSRFPAWWSHWDRRQPAKPKSVTDVGGGKETILYQIDSRLTFLRCALSPQDEVLEKESLETGEIMLNPTFETVQRPLSAQSGNLPLLAFCRADDKVVHRAIAELEALIVDSVRESFRTSEDHLIAAIVAESRIESEFVKKAIIKLSDDGFLLRS